MKYAKLIEKMTLKEKASLMSGQNFWNTKAIERLGIPGIMLTDGPHGLRKQGGKADHLGLNKSIPATCFPTAATLANSWDGELLERVGQCLSKEASSEKVSVLLGPGLNIKKNPLCGRNFEYFSEDPYLSGKLAAAMIRGIQSSGISACPKHFAVNSQETRRMVIDEVVDERAFREIYLEGFRYAVQEGKAKTIMTSYNKINGVYANENRHLLQDILYGEWGFDGVTVTDWGGENDRIEGLKAGNQLEMPSSSGMTDKEIVEAVRSGKLDEKLLNQRVDELLNLILDTKKALQNKIKVSYEKHHQIARKAAAKSYVLLKNEEDILPLSNKRTVAVIGDFAKCARYQGAGSSLIQPIKVENALEELAKTKIKIVGYHPGFKRFGKKHQGMKQQAIALAKKADVVLLFLGLDESAETEGVDRKDMKLPNNQVELLEAIYKVNPHIAVVVSGGAPIETPWANKTKAILLSYLGGEASGGAVADILTGVVSPSGKLAETYPITYKDVPFHKEFPGKQMIGKHKESIYVGYRYYDTAKVDVAWPFGHGLSYTKFSYSDLEIQEAGASFTIKNVGKRAGAEIAQIYISKSNSAVFRAEKELKGFCKVFLKPDEERKIFIPWNEHSFCYFDIKENRWVEEPGTYEIKVGASCKDIKLNGTIERVGEIVENPYENIYIPHYESGKVNRALDEEWEAILGRQIPKEEWDTNKILGYNDTIGQGQYKKGFGRFLYRGLLLGRKLCFLVGKPIVGNYVMFIMDLPFRHVARMSGGKVDMAMLDGLLVMVNESFCKGFGQLLKAWKAKINREKKK